MSARDRHSVGADLRVRPGVGVIESRIPNPESLVYATEMHSAHELLMRWPALDISARQPRLAQTLRLAAGSLQHELTADAAAAERAAAGLWRRDPSVWSSDPRAHKT